MRVNGSLVAFIKIRRPVTNTNYFNWLYFKEVNKKGPLKRGNVWASNDCLPYEKKKSVPAILHHHCLLVYQTP